MEVLCVVFFFSLVKYGQTITWNITLLLYKCGYGYESRSMTYLNIHLIVIYENVKHLSSHILVLIESKVRQTG